MTAPPDTREQLVRVFLQWRAAGHELGVAELLDALAAIDRGWGEGDPEEVKQMAVLLWCRSPEERDWLLISWAELAGAPAPPMSPLAIARPPAPMGVPPVQTPGTVTISTPVPVTSPPSALPPLEVLPVRAPITSWSHADTGELSPYWPVPRRNMIYTWRYLRRPIPDTL